MDDHLPPVVLPFPPEIIYKILAFVTLSTAEEELRSHKHAPNRLLSILKSQISTLQTVFSIPREWILEAHFNHNEQRVHLGVDVIYALPKTQSIPIDVIAIIEAGTFQDDDLFFRRVKHFGIVAAPGGSLGLLGEAPAQKAADIVSCCMGLLSVTVYLDQATVEAPTLLRQEVKLAVERMERKRNGGEPAPGANALMDEEGTAMLKKSGKGDNGDVELMQEKRKIELSFVGAPHHE